MRMYDEEVKCSKKEHKCYKCKKNIEIGSNYFIIKNRENWGRTVLSDKMCPECYNKLPDNEKKIPQPKKPVERKPRAIKRCKTIAEHELELMCKELDISILREELESLTKKFINEEAEAMFYRLQIETAKKKGKERFNEKVFLRDKHNKGE